MSIRRKILKLAAQGICSAAVGWLMPDWLLRKACRFLYQCYWQKQLPILAELLSQPNHIMDEIPFI